MREIHGHTEKRGIAVCRCGEGASFGCVQRSKETRCKNDRVLFQAGINKMGWSRFLVSLIRLRDGSVAYRHLRLYLGRSIMIGLELLIAADIIHSVAVDPNFATVGVLGLIVLVRTFLSWSIDVEINGEWPWQRARFHKGELPSPDEV